MPLLTFLAQFIGFLFIVIGLSVIIRKKLFIDVVNEIEHSQSLLYVLGLISLFLGLFITLTFNVWNQNLPALIVTLVGWVLVIKGVFVMLVPRKTVVHVARTVKVEKYYWAYGLIVLVIGLYLAYSGFFV